MWSGLLLECYTTLLEGGVVYNCTWLGVGMLTVNRLEESKETCSRQLKAVYVHACMQVDRTLVRLRRHACL